MSPTPDFLMPNFAPNDDPSNQNPHNLSDSRGGLIKIQQMLPLNIPTESRGRDESQEDLQGQSSPRTSNFAGGQ